MKKPKPLTCTEKSLIIYFLDELLEIQSNAGCNDFELPDTKENREIVVCAESYNDDPDYEGPDISDGKIYTDDHTITYYLTERLKEVL